MSHQTPLVVTTLLNAATARLVQRAITSDRIVSCTRVFDFVNALERERVDVALVDPSVDAEASEMRIGVDPVVRALSRASGPPFVLYLSDAHAPLARRAALVHLRPAMVAARGIDDHPDRLRTIIAQAAQSRIPDDLLAAIAEAMARLDARVRDALAYAIRYPLECDSLDAVASAAGRSDRALRRALSDARLAPPRAWLVAARVLRAYWELRDDDVNIRHVVALMGYSSEAPLANDVDIVTGTTPSKLRRTSAADLVAVVAKMLAHRSGVRSLPERRDGAADIRRPGRIDSDPAVELEA